MGHTGRLQRLEGRLSHAEQRKGISHAEQRKGTEKLSFNVFGSKELHFDELLSEPLPSSVVDSALGLPQ